MGAMRDRACAALPQNAVFRARLIIAKKAGLPWQALLASNVEPNEIQHRHVEPIPRLPGWLEPNSQSSITRSRLVGYLRNLDTNPNRRR